MIDISQWRVSIGLWCCYHIPDATKCLPLGTAVDAWMESLWSRELGNDDGDNLALFLVLFFLLLILSGDVELNPGPRTDKHKNI